MAKRPLCIDSKVVEKIDRYSVAKVESVYRCSVNKTTPFSSYYYEQLPGISFRVQQIERILAQIEPFQQKIQLTIFEDHPYLFRIQDHRIFIGAALLDAPGHLEKALAKVWFRERNASLFLQQNLIEEITTDFLIYLASGDLDVGDPKTMKVTAVRKGHWPQAVKSVAEYCDSPWKQSEHYLDCSDKVRQVFAFDGRDSDMVLRPLLTSTWIQAYKQLSVKNRFKFVESLPLLLRSEHSPVLPVTEILSQPQMEITVLFRMTEAMNNIGAYIANANVVQTSSALRFFLANFASQLKVSGFQGSFAAAKFDFLYVSDKPLDASSEAFKHFTKLAQSHPNMQFALKDEKNLWILPSTHPVDVTTFGKLEVHRTVVEKCGGYKFNYIMEYADVTEKLLVVESCDPEAPVKYSRYIEEGAEGFGAQNLGVTFVQFHLPSLLMKKNELVDAGNVFEFIQKRDIESPSFKSLGWQEIYWNSQANAYHPKAFVDAIEWFRVQNRMQSLPANR